MSADWIWCTVLSAALYGVGMGGILLWDTKDLKAALVGLATGVVIGGIWGLLVAAMFLSGG